VGRMAFSVGVTRREKSGGVTGYFAAFIWDVGPPDGDLPIGAATYELSKNVAFDGSPEGNLRLSMLVEVFGQMHEARVERFSSIGREQFQSS
jgi:hypothetical protein